MSQIHKMCMYGATYEGVGDAIQKHHNTSPDCTIITLNSSLYLDYCAILIKKTFRQMFVIDKYHDICWFQSDLTNSKFLSI